MTRLARPILPKTPAARLDGVADAHDRDVGELVGDGLEDRVLGLRRGL